MMELDEAVRTLDIPSTATLNEAKVAYRRLALIHHPDRGGNEEVFKRVSEAYLVVKDRLDELVQPAAEPAPGDLVSRDVDDLIERYKVDLRRPSGGDGEIDETEAYNMDKKSFLGRPSGGYRK